jgi:hypothetical protein
MDPTTLCAENQEAAAPSTPFASKMQSLYEVCQLHCSTKNLTRRCVQLAVRNSWLPSLLARLAQVMGH